MEPTVERAGGEAIDRAFYQNLDLPGKIEQGKTVVREAFDRFNSEKVVVAWTGGKDSTVMLWLIREVCRERNCRIPDLIFINEGCVFEEVLAFKDQIERDWVLTIHEVRNEDVMRLVRKPGDLVTVSDLGARNREELAKLNYTEPTFVWEPESYVGNHLMKTVAMNLFLEANTIAAMYTGVRWDEQSARSKEVYFSPRQTPDHYRIHPILHFKERDIWNVIRTHQIPVNPLYAQGYRSLGTKDTTTKSSDMPAWEQDLENTTERQGRRQDKEGIMERLRELGYM
ncbi:MAG TPA: phosphoadenosine phosphosulfate reductase family protein [Nitrospiria bacterium]|nr:phosphoadenosine phosphosulfate reductase family protein [Nitrospiria bacterium]